MKLKHVVALLGLTACVPAFAVDFVANSGAQSVIGTGPASEATLQSIVNGLFGAGINVNTGQSSAGMFASATPSAASSIPTMIAEWTANSANQRFGMWFGTDTTNVVTYDLMLGGATALTTAAISFVGNTLKVGSSDIDDCGVKVNCGKFEHALVNPYSFGFYFRPLGAPDNNPTYYSLDQLNTGDRTDRVIAFQQGASTNWLLAYEDGGRYADWDYNDMVVKVESITTPIPEPETYALMLAGLGAVGYMSRRRKKA
ncbi:MAG TPA: PEP-CTERM sorting domain-containing protein [Caldimonas sp.]|jgi:hypothetical protein|nr:PEP-CTERM sorting domain-containing protein [Caldimonas sp.]HEX2542119.1 PEP-CTERM sorting domain-containing protein [Caldimonas sp.]